MKAWALVLVLIAVSAAAGVWWRFSRGSADVDAAMAIVQPGDPLEKIVGKFGIGDCWRKRPDTGEMVCHYLGARHSYSARFRAGNVVEVVQDRRLGGIAMPPFNNPVDLVLAPER